MGLDRRGFLTLVAGGAIGTLFTPLPWKTIDNISIWTQNWPWIPRLKYGPREALATTVKLGASEYGIMINTIGGRPVTASGSTEDPLSQGGIDPLAGSSVQLLYSQARIVDPMKKNSDGKFEAITWDEAQSRLREKLSNIQGQNNKLACISGDETSSANDILRAFVSKMGSDAFFALPSDQADIVSVWKENFKAQGRPGYDLENSDHILILGADLLESWGTVVRNQAVFGSDQQKKFIYAGPALNNTAAVANEWIPVQEQKLGHLALALCYQLLQMGAVPARVPGIRQFESFLQKEYGPQNAESQTGLKEDKIIKLAKDLSQADAPLVVSGSSAALGGNRFVHIAGMLLNIVLGQVGKKGGVTVIADAPDLLQDEVSSSKSEFTDCMAYLYELKNQEQTMPEVMFFYEANPAYSLPQVQGMKKILEKVPFKVSFSQFMDETAKLCDLILPAPYFLERLDDSYSPFGVGQASYRLTLPVVEPQTNSKPTPDVIFELARDLGLDFTQKSYKAIMKSRAEQLGADWKALNKGKTWMSKPDYQQVNLQIKTQELAELALEGEKSKAAYPLSLVPAYNLRTGSKSIAMPPAGLHTLLENKLQQGDFFVRLNGKTAKKFGVSQGMPVSLQSPAGKCRARVDIYEGVMDNAVLAPLGFGHSAWDMFSKDKGDNVYKLLQISETGEQGLIQWSDTRVKIAKI